MVKEITTRKLFLIDAVGALVSAVMLGTVLVRFESFFGMPPKVLYPLSFAACFFAIYSSTCCIKRAGKPFLRSIALFNLTYCLVTLGLVIWYRQQLTVWGILYFVGEMILIVVLSTIELKAARR